MEKYDKLELLGRAFAYGEADAIADCLNENCKYNSDYAKKHLSSADRILAHMREVNENMQPDAEKKSHYDYKIVRLADIFKEGIDIDDLHGQSLWDVFEYGLLLYQSEDPAPAAVVFVKFNLAGMITEINLSRSHKWFDMKFYGEEDAADEEKDIPYTVMPMTSYDREVQEIQEAFTKQPHESAEPDDSGVYIWKEADRFFKAWLEYKGYYVLESEVFDDNIGYQCTYNNHAYTVYMFALGQEERMRVDRTYWATLADREFSKGFVLMAYLRVEREFTGDKISYKVGVRTDDENYGIELWHPCRIDEKDAILYFPGEYTFEMMDKLIYAFNKESLDAFSCIISENASYTGYDDNEASSDEEFYASMLRVHQTKGEMQRGYYTDNGILYSMLPYIDGYGWFDFDVDAKRKVCRIASHPFEEEGIRFVKSGESIAEDTFADIPALMAVDALPRVLTERFAVKATFENGIVKKFVLPVAREDEEAETVNFRGYDFSDEIWQSAYVDECPKPWYKGFRNCLPGVVFQNGFVLSGMQIYEEGTIYSEPAVEKKIIYEDETLKLEQLWIWDANSIHEDAETGALHVLLRGETFNAGGISTIASIDGKRSSSLDLVYLTGAKEGLTLAGVAGRGYGFLDKDGNFVIPPIYTRAENFEQGHAHALRNGKSVFVNRDGKEIKIESKYQDIGKFSDGLCKVSTLGLSFMDVAHSSDTYEAAGIWGFVDESGREVIAPQYIYAYDFYNGISIVCKGEWRKDSKWDKYNQGRYWTEKELWGGINRKGEEVIPCIFDEIKWMDDDSNVFRAHYGGWENGHWGVIDRNGNWLAEPVFEDVDIIYFHDMFAFYNSDMDEDDALLGIYDTKQKKVIFEPQFLDVNYVDDNYIRVEIFDEKHGRTIEKIIDREGKEKFPSDYSKIYPYEDRDVWEVCREINEERRGGLIDRDGNVVLPCVYDIVMDGVYEKYKRVIVKSDDGKVTMLDFDGNTIIPAKYDSITGLNQPLYRVGVKVGENRELEGLVTHTGREILVPVYRFVHFCRDNHIICGDEAGCRMMKLTMK